LAAPHAPEPPASWPDYFSVNEEEAHMPAIIIPVLWVGGAAILLGAVGTLSAPWCIELMRRHVFPGCRFAQQRDEKD
ncbi:MAG: hypothetical protein WA711_14205, partial [Pseudolabrys sp.]